MATLRRLAKADAFKPAIGLVRRDALFAVRALRDDPLCAGSQTSRQMRPTVVGIGECREDETDDCDTLDQNQKSVRIRYALTEGAEYLFELGRNHPVVGMNFRSLTCDVSPIRIR